MLRFFRSSNSIVIVAVLLIGALTWLHALIGAEAPPADKYGTFLFRALTGWLTGIPGLVTWCGLVLLLLAAFLLIFVNNRLHLIDKISYFPGLCYILLIGGIPSLHCFNPAVIAAILLATGFVLLVKSFESEKLSYRFFTASIFISAATFFYQYMYVYMLAMWLSIMFMRPGYWREWVFSILGFALPVFFAFSWFFLVNDDYTYMGTFFGEIFSVERSFPSLPVSTIIFFAISIVVVIITFGHLMRYLGSKKIIIRNGYYILFMFAIITMILSVIVPDMLPFAWYLMAFPMSFVLSNYLATVRSVRWGTIVLAALFAGVVIAQAIG